MPIYAYRCGTCGQAKDVLQKMSDPVLTVCPFCGASTFVKQVTAAGFQLKGSGWYVTDFRGDSKAPKAADGVTSPPDAPKAEGGGSDAAAPAPAKSDSPAAPGPAPASASAPASAPAPSAPAAPSGGTAAGSK